MQFLIVAQWLRLHTAPIYGQLYLNTAYLSKPFSRES